MERPVFVGHNRIQKAFPPPNRRREPLLARRESATRFHLGRSDPLDPQTTATVSFHIRSPIPQIDASHSGELRLLCRSGVVICRACVRKKNDLFGSKVMGYPGVEFPQRLG